LQKKDWKELEKVLEHYRKNPGDSLKYKTAVFLIENMDIQFSYQSKQLETYFYHLNFIGRMDNTDEPITEKREALIKNLHFPNRRLLPPPPGSRPDWRYFHGRHGASCRADRRWTVEQSAATRSHRYFYYA
jgi:hypothetical protein